VLEFVLPYPVSLNAMYITTTLKGHARPMVMITKQGREYKAKVRQIVLAMPFKPILGRVGCEINLFPYLPLDHAKRKRLKGCNWDDDVRCLDLDNALKVTLDSLKGLVFEDDKWVRKLICERKEPDEKGGRLVVRITKIESEDVQNVLI
jgi:crossover junction endodeoxyribonuclease RusA